MLQNSKRGSSRRKGDEYQDLTALWFALENYIARDSFKLFLEYENSGNLDDIVLFNENTITAYQVKYAINPLAVYQITDLTNVESPVFLKKFADSWNILKKRYSEYSLTACLCSNRGLDAELLDLITPEGKFSSAVIEDRRRGNAKKLRSDLETASGLDAEPFAAFLADFKFVLRKPTLVELEQYIRVVLIDRELGISEDAIFYDMKEAIKQNAIYSHDAITTESIDNLLKGLQNKLLIPQVFPVNQDYFIEESSLLEKLNQGLSQRHTGYLIVTGLPGSGKSTSLTMYFDSLNKSKYEVFSYYCFIGVNDNFQKMRVQADSLRANLLNEFQRRYPNILKRRFDYSEQNFFKCLQTLAEFFVQKKRRFIIFLDGLDHAERLEPEIRQTVIAALPSEVPDNVLIVVGTQELHNWPYFLRQARECPDSHIKMPLFSKNETQDYLENKRNIIGLSNSDISEIHNKCEGLPLYLQYIAESLISSDSLKDDIVSLPPAIGGDIRKYYGLLWNEFEAVGMANTKHLCTIMACAYFSLHRDELYNITSFDRPTFENAFKYVSHLFRDSDSRLTVFHDSFREFVINQMPKEWVKEIKSNICSFLKRNKDSPRWFDHVFKYCYDTEDYTYVMDEVNSDFVDRALMHCRPSEKIFDALYWAIESAFKAKDIVQLSRLGVLKFRTNERLEYNLNRVLLAKALLALGRQQDVITFAYSPETNHWLVDTKTSLAVMYSLATEGQFDLGQQLFDVFIKEFQGFDSDNGTEVRLQVCAMAQCLGIYMKEQVNSLKWLSNFNFAPDVLEQEDVYVPGYAPHLAIYIDTLVKFGFISKWKQLKRLKKLFPNRLVRYLVIRSLAKHDIIDELRANISEYWEEEQSLGNVELAFYAAKAGMPASEVFSIAGTIEAPKAISPDYIHPSDSMLKRYTYSFIVLAYEGNEEAYTSLINTVGTAKTIWTAALQHLLKACRCIGCSFRGESDWYKDACESIYILSHAEQGDGERIFELLDLIRKVLLLSIFLLTEQVQKCFPKLLGKWISNLGLLRDSFFWNTHLGISESRQDYDFELQLWENIAEIHQVPQWLAPVLSSCAETYEKSTMLKGGCRSDHFIWLSAIMAKCGMHDDSNKWLNYGIKSSLIYGYHKDITLLYLIDVLKLTNQHQPELSLERCARLLSMVDWMPHLTDGRETKNFLEIAFETVLEVNQHAAFELIKSFSQSKSIWQMEDCLEKYLMGMSDGDPEYLWCLAEIFSNHNSQQIMGTRRHIIDIANQSCSKKVCDDLKNRFRNFVLTEINPRHWPKHFKEEFDISAEIDGENDGDTYVKPKLSSEYILDSENITIECIIEKCKISFAEFLTTISKLKKQNEHFYEPDIIKVSLRHHIFVAKSLGDLIPIKEYIESQDRYQDSNIIESLADKFMDFADYDNAIFCYGKAYNCYGSWCRWRNNKKYLAAIAAVNGQSAKDFLIKECYESTFGSECGYDTPPIAATGLDVLDEPQMIEDVFNDFITLCESMFVQLPKDESYEWLKDYREPASYDINQSIVIFVIDELSTPDIDHGERLIKALTSLAIARHDDAIPVLIYRVILASDRVLRRLLTVLYSIASQYPSYLVPYQQELAELLGREDFLCRQTILYIFKSINKVSPLENTIANSIDKIDLNYSTAIYNSSYTMSSCPTREFIVFLKRNTLRSFYEKIDLIESVIQVPSNSLVAVIEERLRSQNWSMDDERIRVRDDWRGHVHAQGWPVVWITTEFEELATNLLWNILDEAATKFKLNIEQHQWLWDIIQIADSEYVLNNIMPRPSDIKRLCINDKQIWLNELSGLERIQIGSGKKLEENREWITVFEKRLLSQDKQYNVPYKQNFSQEAFLIPQQLYGSAYKLDELELVTERIVPYSAMSVTIQQIQTELKSRFLDMSNYDTIPLIANHQNPLTFLGYRNVCSLASFIINEWNLSFEGLNLIKDGHVVAKYEAWQEGYQDGDYTQEKLSFGIRFQVRIDLLAEICRRYHKILCISIDEERGWHKSIYKPEPDDMRESKRYVLYHL
jgi:hypothetical protein